MKQNTLNFENTFEQRRLNRLCGCRLPQDKPFCYTGSITPVVEVDPEIDQFLRDLSKQRFGCDRISPELARRTDLSPAVMNFVRDVLFKELPANNSSFIPDELTEDDEFVLQMFDDRRYTSHSDKMQMRKRLSEYIESHSKKDKS